MFSQRNGNGIDKNKNIGLIPDVIFHSDAEANLLETKHYESKIQAV